MLRIGFFGAALALAMAATPPADAAPGGGTQDQAEEAGDGTPDTLAAPPKQQRRKRSRRHARVDGRVVPEDRLRQEPLDRPSGRIHLSLPTRHEDVEVNIYNDDGSYNVDSLRALDHILRCRRTEAEKSIEPRIFALLSHISDHFDGKTIEVVSGYRNQRRKTSNHFKGTATDIRIQGVHIKKLRAFAETLDTGGMGIGIYPRSGFVHIDVRPAPSYRWVDYSPPNPDAPDKRPPRGWKRKKLQS